jgi:thiol-disulfide isomerase/thioredoxin
MWHPVALMSTRRLIATLAVLAVAVLVAVGIAESRSQTATAPPKVLTQAEVKARVAGAGEPFAALYAQSSQLLPGGLPALRRRLGVLRGHPVVVNTWASWCIPCREDFPLFQHAATDLAGRVAFIGIASNGSSHSDSEALLAKIPLPYPSYWDPTGRAATGLTGSAFLPVTMFINPRGETYVRQGAYPSLAKLEAEIRRYAES